MTSPRTSAQTASPVARLRTLGRCAIGHGVAAAVLLLSGVAVVLAVAGLLAFLLAASIAHAAATAVSWLLDIAASLFERARKRPSEAGLPKAGE